MWPRSRGSIADGQQAFRALKYAPFPVVGGAGRHGARRRLRDPAPLRRRCRRTPRPTWGSVEVGVGVIPGWGGCKEMLGRWSTNPKRPGGPMPPVAKVFETDQHRRGFDVGRGGARRRSSCARTRRRHDEPRPPARRRQGEGAGAARRRLHAARSRWSSSLPGPSGRVGAGDGGRRLPRRAARRPRTTRWSPGASPASLTGGDTDVTETVSEDELSRLEREAFIALVKTPAPSPASSTCSTPASRCAN